MKIKEALNDGTLSLEDNIDYADMTEEEYKQEIERLNNIIKEVREYLEPIELISIKGKMKQDILEILDKGE